MNITKAVRQVRKANEAAESSNREVVWIDVARADLSPSHIGPEWLDKYYSKEEMEENIATLEQ